MLKEKLSGVVSSAETEKERLSYSAVETSQGVASVYWKIVSLSPPSTYILEPSVLNRTSKTLFVSEETEKETLSLLIEEISAKALFICTKRINKNTEKANATTIIKGRGD